MKVPPEDSEETCDSRDGEGERDGGMGRGKERERRVERQRDERHARTIWSSCQTRA